MIKYILFLFYISFSSSLFSQSCECSEMQYLTDVISCDPKILSNDSRIYWNYSCDSSWLSFENPSGVQKILYTLSKEFISLTGRIGFVHFQEYEHVILFTNAVASGCCHPDDYYVYDKNDGSFITYLGRAIYVGDSISAPFVVSITNSGFVESSSFDTGSLTIYNLDTRKQFKIPFEKGLIETGMENNNYFYPEDIFDEVKVENDSLIINYHVDQYIDGVELEQKTLVIDLRKYKILNQ